MDSMMSANVSSQSQGLVMKLSTVVSSVGSVFKMNGAMNVYAIPTVFQTEGCGPVTDFITENIGGVRIMQPDAIADVAHNPIVWTDGVVVACFYQDALIIRQGAGFEFIHTNDIAFNNVVIRPQQDPCNTGSNNQVIAETRIVPKGFGNDAMNQQHSHDEHDA